VIAAQERRHRLIRGNEPVRRAREHACADLRQHLIHPFREPVQAVVQDFQRLNEGVLHEHVRALTCELVPRHVLPTERDQPID